MAAKRALVTGITGQDGSYLAEFLLEKGYEVHGMVRRSSTETFQRLEGFRDDLVLHTGDLLDQRSLLDVLRECEPDEIYNLAAMSFVAASWSQPVLTAEFTATGVTRMLEAMREGAPEARFYQASSSEMFGKVLEVPQRETTPFYPRSPYGVAKCYGHFITVNYRESYDLFAASGSCSTTSRERRGLEFVTRKVTHAAAGIKLGLQDELALGNLDAERDWGYAPDYVEAMWLMLQEDEPDDYVIATGEVHSVRELVEVAFDHVGLPSDQYVRIDERFLRPAEVEHLVGDATKAKEKLGWVPQDQLRGDDPADGRLRPRAARAARGAAKASGLGRGRRCRLRDWRERVRRAAPPRRSSATGRSRRRVRSSTCWTATRCGARWPTRVRSASSTSRPTPRWLARGRTRPACCATTSR